MGPNLLVSSSLILFLDPTRVALRDSQFKTFLIYLAVMLDVAPFPQSSFTV